jgi:hypothetical protein
MISGAVAWSARRRHLVATKADATVIAPTHAAPLNRARANGSAACHHAGHTPTHGVTGDAVNHGTWSASTAPCSERASLSSDEAEPSVEAARPAHDPATAPSGCSGAVELNLPLKQLSGLRARAPRCHHISAAAEVEQTGAAGCAASAFLPGRRRARTPSHA